MKYSAGVPNYSYSRYSYPGVYQGGTWQLNIQLSSQTGPTGSVESSGTGILSHIMNKYALLVAVG